MLIKKIEIAFNITNQMVIKSLKLHHGRVCPILIFEGTYILMRATVQVSQLSLATSVVHAVRSSYDNSSIFTSRPLNRAPYEVQDYILPSKPVWHRSR